MGAESPFFRFHILLTPFQIKKENLYLKLFLCTFIKSLYLLKPCITPYYPVCLSFVNAVSFSLKLKTTVNFTRVRFVQFFMRLGCGKGVPDPRSQPVLLQYSLNGGLSWSLLQEFLFSNSSNVGRYIALEIPLKARSASTRLRWWQPSENGHFYSPWVIDQVSPFGINY